MEEIPENMTADELSNFFNERTPGIPCPICRHQDWRILGKDGFVRSVRLIDDKGTETILSALKDLRAGKEVTLRDIEKHLDGTLFQNIAVMRCGNCGWVALFDKTFIENEIHNAKINEEDWLHAKIKESLADYVQKSEFKPTEEKAGAAFTRVGDLWTIFFWVDSFLIAALGGLLLIILHLHHIF